MGKRSKAKPWGISTIYCNKHQDFYYLGGKCPRCESERIREVFTIFKPQKNERKNKTIT